MAQRNPTADASRKGRHGFGASPKTRESTRRPQVLRRAGRQTPRRCLSHEVSAEAENKLVDQTSFRSVIPSGDSQESPAGSNDAPRKDKTMKNQINSNLIGEPVTVTRRKWEGSNPIETKWQGIIRSVYPDEDGHPKYTVQAIMTEPHAGELSEHYAGEFVLANVRG